MKHSSFILGFATAALAAGAAQADYLKLYAPRVEKGEVAAEADWNISADHRDEKDKYFSQVYALEYGVNDWWKTELGAEIEKENGDSTKLTNLKWENVFAPFKPGENWIDAGLYVELEKAARDHEPNTTEVKLLLEKDVGNWQTIANIGTSREFGQNHSNDWGGSGALRVGYRLNSLFEPGLEYYADVGDINNAGSYADQEHLAGPVIYGKYGKLKYDTGLLFGMSREAPDATAKLNLEYEF